MKPTPFARSRAASFTLIAALYAAAFFAGALVYARVAQDAHPLVAMLAADVAATLVVFAASMLTRNSSLYDPYWSVAPLAIIAVWQLQRGVASLPDLLLLIAVAFWGVRLTANWAVRWKGLAHEDWRYELYRARAPRLWPLTNLFGIHLMPTLLVYAALLPAYLAPGSARPAGPLMLLGFAVCIGSAVLQLVADGQMEAFRRRGGEGCIEEGLWRVCRHPNYLGEICFWWGLWLMQLGAGGFLLTAAGAALITLLFVFVSIPLMEAHVLASRPDYTQIQKKVPMLLPLMRRRQEDDTIKEAH